MENLLVLAHLGYQVDIIKERSLPFIDSHISFTPGIPDPSQPSRLRDKVIQHLTELSTSSSHSMDVDSHRKLIPLLTEGLPHQYGVLKDNTLTKPFMYLISQYFHPVPEFGTAKRQRSALDQTLLAATHTGNIGVVPLMTRPGDLVMHVTGCTTSIVLTKIDSGVDTHRDAKIRDRFKARHTDDHGGVLKEHAPIYLEGDGSIEHCAVVGQSLFDGERGWTGHEKYEHKVFALH
jgi:hypothetical protein